MTFMPVNCAKNTYVEPLISFFSSSTINCFAGFMFVSLRSRGVIVNLDFEAGTHRRSQRAALHIVTLRRRRLRVQHGADDRMRVIDERLLLERRLAERHVDVG